MFRNSSIVRPLYDTLNGGPPKAFECLIPKPGAEHWHHDTMTYDPCGKITRTERGMRMHLKLVHHFEAQQCLFSTDNQTSGQSERK